MQSQQKSSRAMGLFALLAASLVACPNPPPTGQSLSIEVNARSLAITMFVNARDGSLLESKTANANTGKQTLVFGNVPSNTTVTRVFQGTTQRFDAATNQNVTIPYISLSTYSASEAVKYIFNSPTGVAAQPLLSVYAKFTAKPTLPDFKYFNALGYNVEYTNGTNDIVDLKSPLYQFDLQTDVNFSEVFLAFNSKNETIGYITYLDKPVPAPENSIVAPDFTVVPTDWKTDMSTMPININNLEPGTGANYSAWISGQRKGVGHVSGYGQSTVDAVANTVTINAKYPPVFFDTYNYILRYSAKNSTQAGQPSTNHTTVKRGLVSLPTTPTFDAKTDFLASPSNLGYSETGRPALTWTYTAPASVVEVYAGIFNQTDDADYIWFFDFPKTTSSLIVPALPANFAAWDPKGDGRKYRFYVNASEYNPTTKSPGGNRFSGASRNFSNDVGLAALEARAVNVRQRELQDKLQDELQDELQDDLQDKPNSLDEIKSP